MATDVRGHPVRSFRNLMYDNRLFVMRPEQREEVRLEVIKLGEKLVDLGYITQDEFDAVCEAREAE